MLILIGGWTGKKRSNTVHAFDVVKKGWISLKEWPDGKNRVQPPVGLSNHTATAINDNLICVLGREGGIKTQRRFGDLFLLHLDLGKYFSHLERICLNKYSKNETFTTRLHRQPMVFKT